MLYRIGVIGIGHWFGRLHAGMITVGGLEVVKALGTRPYESKAETLKGFGIGSGMYLTTDKTGAIPDAFFDGIDAVHVSDPNMYHARQTIDSLEHGKKAIVEKSFAVTRDEFDEFESYVKGRKKESEVYLHLHYMHKQPTIALRKSIGALTEKYGKVTEVRSTFFEAANEEDERRAAWLFGPENGGLFMDWIHPFEVAYHATGSRFGKMTELGIYAVNPGYDSANPTGVYASTEVSGGYFAVGARFSVSIAKGTDARFAQKAMRLYFESGASATLRFTGSEHEFSGQRRGSLEVGELRSGVYRSLESRELEGENSSEIFVREILELCSGRNHGLGLNEIAGIFAPQWEYQHMLDSVELTKDPRAVRRFLDRAVRL